MYLLLPSHVLFQASTFIAGELVMASSRLKAQKLEVFQVKDVIVPKARLCTISNDNNFK